LWELFIVLSTALEYSVDLIKTRSKDSITLTIYIQRESRSANAYYINRFNLFFFYYAWHNKRKSRSGVDRRDSHCLTDVFTDLLIKGDISPLNVGLGRKVDFQRK